MPVVFYSFFASAVSMRNGDLILFNPLVYHCLSSKAIKNENVISTSLYLKTGVVSHNNLRTLEDINKTLDNFQSQFLCQSLINIGFHTMIVLTMNCSQRIRRVCVVVSRRRKSILIMEK
jgi:hypothetical protein